MTLEETIARTLDLDAISEVTIAQWAVRHTLGNNLERVKAAIEAERCLRMRVVPSITAESMRQWKAKKSDTERAAPALKPQRRSR
jgi:hypothetical protein